MGEAFKGRYLNSLLKPRLRHQPNQIWFCPKREAFRAERKQNKAPSPEERGLGVRRKFNIPARGVNHTLMHAAQCPDAFCSNGGSISAHAPIAIGQRVR